MDENKNEVNKENEDVKSLTDDLGCKLHDAVTTKKDESSHKGLHNFLGGLLLGVFCGIILIFALAPSLNGSNTSDDAFVSNLTNASLVQGYVVGYNDCQQGLVELANSSISSCRSITFNMSGVIAEFVPRNCLK